MHFGAPAAAVSTQYRTATSLAVPGTAAVAAALHFELYAYETGTVPDTAAGAAGIVVLAPTLAVAGMDPATLEVTVMLPVPEILFGALPSLFDLNSVIAAATDDALFLASVFRPLR